LDQIHEKSPSWQPVIIDYRRKRTAEGILNLEKKLAQESTAGGNEEPLPKGIEPPLPTKEPAAGGGASATTLGDLVANETRKIKDQFEKVQRELKEAQREKEELAEKLDNTLKQLSQTRINEAEIKAKLSQAQDALSNAQTDNSKSVAGQKTMEMEV